MNVTVIGGAGRVGLPMCIVMANAGHQVHGYDIDEKTNALISSGVMPFHEDCGQDQLNAALDSGRLQMTSDNTVVSDSDVIVIVIGTPVDENMNPVLEPLHRLISDIAPLLRQDQLIILRSTVSPGTTDQIRQLVEDLTDMSIGSDLHLVFAPERVAQGKAIKELPELPQLIGCYDYNAFVEAKEFFETFLNAKCFELSPLEAEIGKLITNMSRYVTFALANEFHMIADSFGVNINKIIDACTEDYPRLDIPSPGPNVGGPCLYKDGWFLIERIPYAELISTSFHINESMPMQIVQKLRQMPNVRKVTILGMTFKANSDDIRNSVSFKLKKILNRLGYESICIEPNLSTFDSDDAMAGSDAVVLMSPHDEFQDLGRIRSTVSNRECLFVDIWGFWTQMRHRSNNGYFFSHEVPE